MRFDSPLERIFYHTWLDAGGERYFKLIHQYTWSSYRFDFVVPNVKLAIELDGFKWHKSIDQFVYDRKRQREAELHGWRFIRFAGKEIINKPKACVKEVKNFITYLEGIKL